MYFGCIATAEISILSFFIAAGISILILIFRKIKKSDDEYIPFGPFLVIAAILRTFVSFWKIISDKIIGGI